MWPVNMCECPPPPPTAAHHPPPVSRLRAAFATENTPEVRLPPPHIAVEHTDACQLDIRCAARAAGHRSTCDVVGQEGVLCDTIIGKPVHSFRSSSGDARPTYSSWMVAAMMAATPIQLPVRVRHHISPLCACWRPQWLLPSSPFFTQRRCLQHVLFGCRSSTLIIFTPRGWWGDRTVPVPE